MRLSVFSAASSQQLLIDLKKIYQDYLTAEQLSSESLQAMVDNQQQHLFVTMFNERHLGAVQVSIAEQQAQLDLLTVRDLTRRRGVAKNLLREVEKHLKTKNVTQVKMALTGIKEEEIEGLTLFMQACGYQLSDGVFGKDL